MPHVRLKHSLRHLWKSAIATSVVIFFLELIVMLFIVPQIMRFPFLRDIQNNISLNTLFVIEALIDSLFLALLVVPLLWFFLVRPFQQTAASEQAHHQAILEAAPNGIMVINSKGIIQSVNSSILSIFGYKEHELIGHNVSMLTPEPIRSQHDGYLRRYLKARSTHSAVVGLNIEIQAIRKDDTLVWIHLAVGEVYNKENISSQLFTGIIHDLTSEKEAEQKINEYAKQLEHNNTRLREALQQAEIATRSKNQFLANMSHELRTPLTAILGFSEMALHDSDTDLQAQNEALQAIHSSGDHLLTLVNDILDLSKVETGILAIESIKLDPWKVITEILEILKNQAQKAGLQIAITCINEIPQTIVNDPIRLRQILMNVVGNAIKFTQVGRIQVNISCEKDSQTLRFDVIDTGIGLTSKQIEYIFTPFNQADPSMTREFGGTGLGLSISQKLARLMGGDITIDSTPNKGSTFSIFIGTGDLAHASWIQHRDTNTTTHSPLTVKKKNTQSLEGFTILLAEDGLTNQKLITRILEKAGAQIHLAVNGHIAVNMVRQAAKAGQCFDLILMDIQMPEMDGHTATRTLREADFQLPIIALTAHSMVGDRDKCFEAGCDDYQTKPINRQHLIERCVHWKQQKPQKSASGGFNPTGQTLKGKSRSNSVLQV